MPHDPRARALAHIKSAELKKDATTPGHCALRQGPRLLRWLRMPRVFEKLTADNLGFWTAFADDQIELSGPSGTVRSETRETKTTIRRHKSAQRVARNILGARVRHMDCLC
jgi:hypothetical protein